MQIVIDIPGEMVKALEQGCFGAMYNIYDLCGCVMNGTPLPKGHGRLIDADALFSEYSEVSLPAYIIEPFMNAPIVLEADREVGNADSN